MKGNGIKHFSCGAAETIIKTHIHEL